MQVGAGSVERLQPPHHSEVAYQTERHTRILEVGRKPTAFAGALVLTILRILLGVIQAVLHSAASAFLLLMSMLATAAGVLILVGFLGAGVTGFISLRLSRRRASKRQ